MVKKIMVAAPASGSGKTLVTLGLMKAFSNRGYQVQPYKVGPDYIDTAFHSRATGRFSRNLDSFLLREQTTLCSIFQKNIVDADLAIIEGVMGLYDGLGTDKDYCSSSSVAKQLDCPVLLVIDGKAASTSIAAVVLGFQLFDPDVQLCGVLINNIASENHFLLVKQAIEKYTTVPVLGCLYRNPELHLPSRQLGLIPDIEIENIEQKLAILADEVEKTVELDKVEEVMKVEVISGVPKVQRADFSALTVAYAFDEAFHFYYQDNLDLFKEFGVNLIKFSPLRDRQLPLADLYYLGGGYPEEFAED